MVQITTFALLFLSASSSVLGARRHHNKKRGNVCKPRVTTTASDVPEATVLPVQYNTTASPSTTRIVTSTVSTSKPTQSTKDDGKDNGNNDNNNDGGDDNSGGNDGGSGGGSTSSGDSLFPAAPVETGWTVADTNAPANVKKIAFNDDTFIRTKQTGTTIWKVGDFHGKTAAKTTYNKGSITPGKQPAGGFSFYTPGPKNSGVDLTKATELTFSYSVYFDPDFDFQLGGKMPGLYGGTDDNVAATCSGGRHSPKCWSARLMWRPNGQGELYLYIPQGVGKNDNVCGKSANGKCHGQYGNSAGTGLWNWKRGAWTTVSQRIKLNDAGKQNGEAEVYVEGKSVLKLTGLVWRGDAGAVTRGIQMQTFFGGHTDPWASPKTQDAYWGDFSIGILN